MPNKIGAIIALDGEKEFKQAVTNIDTTLKKLNSELKLSEAQFAGQANSVDALTSKNDILKRTLDEQRNKINELNKGLENAQKTYDKVGEGLKDLEDQYEAAKQKMDEMKSSGTASNDELKAQQKVLDDLRKAIDQGNQNLQTASNRVQNWATRLNSAKTEELKLNQEIEQNEKYLDEASNSADGCAKSIDRYGKELKDSTSQSKKASNEAEDLADEIGDVSEAMEESAESTSVFGDMLAANLASSAIEKGIGILSDGFGKIKEGIASTVSEATNFDKAAQQLQASTGASASEMSKYRDVMLAVKGDNFGESFDDVTEAMSSAITSLGELDTIELTNITESAITLRDAFGMEYQEQMNAVKSLMKNFGITADEAYNLIVQGAQAGLNQNENMLDTLNEYGPKFSAMGFSAEEMFNSLANGVEAGIFDVDKLGDAINEFSIRVKDGTADNTFKDLKLDVEALKKAFGEGGESAQNAFQAVMTAIQSIDDPLEQNRIGVELFGTMWEDTGGKAILALQNTTGEISATKSAMDDLKTVKYDDVATAFSNLGAAVQEKLLTPIADVALPAIKDALDAITAAIDPPKTALEEFQEEIEKSNEEAKESLENAKESMSNAGKEISDLEGYKEALLEINSATEKTEFQKYQLKNIVSELASTIPELSAAFDEETGSLQLTNEELENMFKHQENLILQQASAEAMEKAYKAMYDAKLNAVKAASALEEAEKKEAEALEKHNQAIRNGEINDYTSELTEAQIATDDARKAQEEANKIYETAEKDYRSFSEANRIVTAELSENTEATEENTKAQNENLLAFMVNAESDPAQILEKRKKSIEESTKAQEDALESLRQKYNEVRDSITQSIQNKINPYDIFEGGTDMITEDMNANMEENIRVLKEYQSNLEKVEQMLQDGLIDPEYFEHLLDLGVEGANELGHLVNTYNIGDIEELKRTSDNYVALQREIENTADANAHLKAVHTDYLNTLGSSQEEFDNLQSSFEEMVNSLEDEGKSLSESEKSAFQLMIDAARESGIEIPEGLSEGIKSGEISIDDATAQLQGTMRGKFEYLAEIAEEEGIAIPQALIDAIESGGPEMASAINTLVQMITDGDMYSKLRKAMSNAAKAIGDSGSEIDAQAQKAFSNLIDTAEKYGVEIDSSLIAGIESGSTSIEEGTEILSQSVTEGIEKIIEEAETLGIKLPEGFKNGVEEGNNYTTEAMETLDSAINEKASELTQTMKNLGMEIPAELQAGIDAGGDAAIQAIKDMNALIEEEQSKGADASKKVGEQNAESQAEGTKSKQSVAADAGKSLGESGANGAASTKGSYQSAGQSLGQSVAWGLATQSGNVYDSGFSVAASGANGANSQAPSYRSAGQNLSEQLAAGIRDRKSSVIEAAVETAKAGVESAKLQLGIGVANSANGFSDEYMEAVKDAFKNTEQSRKDAMAVFKKAVLQSTFVRTVTSKMQNNFDVSEFDENGVKKSAEKYYAEIYSAGAKWLSDYKAQNGLTVEEEKKFWQLMTAEVKQGTQAYYQAQTNLSSAKFRLDISDPLKNNFDVKRTDESGKTKDADKYYDELMKAADNWLENYKVTHDVSLQYETYYWQQVQKKVAQGSQAWYDAQKKINDLQKQQQKELLSSSKTALDQYKTYYKVSEYAEVQYWNIVRQQFKEGTEERIEADQKYFEAKQAYNDKLIELNEEYVKSSDEIKEKLKEQTEELRKTYDDAVKERAESIYNSFGLFDEFYSESDSGAVLLNNLKSQVAGYADWELQLKELEKKGISEGLLEELQEMGPQASASLHALNSLTAEQLEEYQQLWQQKHDLAQSRSVEENEDLRKETEEEIKRLTDEARQEILDLRDEYLKAVAEVKETIEQPLKNIAVNANKIGEDVTAQLIAGITSGATKNDYTIELKKSAGSVTEALEDIPKAAKTIGEDALKQLFDGLTDQEKLDVQAKLLADQLSESIKKAAEEDKILRMAVLDYENSQKSSLNEQISSMDASIGRADTIASINQLAATSVRESSVSKEDFSALISQMSDLLATYLPQIAESKQIYLDKDTLVGSTINDISTNLAKSIRRSR